MIADEELARTARAGDVAAFAALTERHRPGMRATAIALLGYTDEAEDAVQDAVLTALRRLGDLRDPAAAGPWLKAIVRNTCRMMLRAHRPLPVAEPGLLLPPRTDETDDTPDWVRSALAELSAPIRDVTLLRYFSGFSSYREIAELCGIPAETVGSRLRDGRRILARRLRETAGAAHAESAGPAGATRAQAADHFAAMHAGRYHRVVEEWYRPDAQVVVLGGLTGDRSTLTAMLDYTLGGGVRARLHDATASGDTLIWESDFLNPADDPGHCPPRMAMLFRIRGGRVARLGVTYGLTPRR